MHVAEKSSRDKKVIVVEEAQNQHIVSTFFPIMGGGIILPNCNYLGIVWYSLMQ